MKKKFIYWFLIKIFAEVSTTTYSYKEAGTITLFDALNHYNPRKEK